MNGKTTLGLVALAVRTARYPRLTLAVTAVLTLLGAWSASRLSPASSLTAMLARDDAAADALARVATNFHPTDELLVVVSLPSNVVGDPVRGAARLRTFARRLDEKAALPPLSEMCVTPATPARKPGLPPVEAAWLGLFHLSDEGFEAFRTRLTTEGIRRQIRRNETLLAIPGPAGSTLARAIRDDPLHLHELFMDFGAASIAMPSPNRRHLLSRDRHSILIRIQGRRPAGDLDFAARFTDAVRQAVEGHEGRRPPGDLEVAYTGAYAIAAKSLRSIRCDMIRSIAASLMLLMALFFLVYRRLRSFPLAVTPVAIGIVTAFAIRSFYSNELTPLVAVIGAVLTGLGIDYSIHFLSHYSRERAHGAGNADATVGALQQVGPAMVAACITSLIGFLAIAGSSVQALRDFAIVGALGLGGSLVACLLVLPALLWLDDRHVSFVIEPRWLRGGVQPFIAKLAKRPRLALAFTGGLGCVGAAYLALSPGPILSFETDLSVMHPRPNPPLAAQRRVAELFEHPADSLLVHLEADSPDALVALSHRVDHALDTDRIRKVGVCDVMGLASLLPDHATAAARRAAIMEIDTERVIADVNTALAGSIFEPSAFAASTDYLRKLLNPNGTPDIATLLRSDLPVRSLLPTSIETDAADATEAVTVVSFDPPLDARLRRDEAVTTLRHALDGIAGATLTGIAVVAHDAERLIRHDLSRLLTVAGVAVSCWLLWFFRSWRRALPALLPALFGIVALIAVMKLFGLRLNSVNLIGIPLLVGIGVDDGIFLVSLAAARGDRRSPNDLPRRLGVGCHAVLMTTLTTLLAFGTLVFTSTPAIQSLGLILAIGMAACLAGTLLLLAPLLLATQRPSEEPPSVVDGLA